MTKREREREREQGVHMQKTKKINDEAKNKTKKETKTATEKQTNKCLELKIVAPNSLMRFAYATCQRSIVPKTSAWG